MALNLWTHAYNSEKQCYDYTLRENVYAGRVLKISRGESYQIMSDIWGSADWALVLNDKNEPERLCMNIYDMGAPEHVSTGEVDATEEVKELYREYLTQRYLSRYVEDETARSERIEKGCTAEVVRGKTAKGTIGKVVVEMNAPYNMGYRSYMLPKYAIATSDVQVDKPLRNGKVAKVYRDVVWVWGKNCRRVDKPAIDKDALLKQAREAALREYPR